MSKHRDNKGRFKKGHKLGIGNMYGWEGGRFKDSREYIRIYNPDHPNSMINKYIYEHRLVMESVLGRYLKKTEIVHHINGNRSDNKPENLRLYKSNRKHASKHKKNKKNPEHAKKIKQAWKEGRLTKVASFKGLSHNKESKKKMSLARKNWWKRRYSDSYQTIS